MFIFYLSLLLGATLLPSANTAQELPLAEALIVHVAVTTPIAISLSYFLFQYLFANFEVSKLKIDSEKFEIEYGLFGLERTVWGKTKDITKVEVAYKSLHGYSQEASSDFFSVVAICLIVEGLKTRQFGRYIKRVEKEWLIEEINNFLF